MRRYTLERSRGNLWFRVALKECAWRGGRRFEHGRSFVGLVGEVELDFLDIVEVSGVDLRGAGEHGGELDRSSQGSKRFLRG